MIFHWTKKFCFFILVKKFLAHHKMYFSFLNEIFNSGSLWQIPNIRLSYRTVKSWWNHRSWKRALFKISRVFNAAKNRTEDRLGYLRFSGFQSNTNSLYFCLHELRIILFSVVNMTEKLRCCQPDLWRVFLTKHGKDLFEGIIKRRKK